VSSFRWSPGAEADALISIPHIPSTCREIQETAHAENTVCAIPQFRYAPYRIFGMSTALLPSRTDSTLAKCHGELEQLTRPSRQHNTSAAPPATGQPVSSAGAAISLFRVAFDFASHGERCARQHLRKRSRPVVSCMGLVCAGARSSGIPFCRFLPSGFWRRVKRSSPFSASLPAFTFRAASAFLAGNSARAERSFLRIVFALSGGTSHRRAAARPGRVWVLLGRNPPQPSPRSGRLPRLGTREQSRSS